MNTSLIHSKIGFDVNDLKFIKGEKGNVMVIRILGDKTEIPLGSLVTNAGTFKEKPGEGISIEKIMNIARSGKTVFSPAIVKAEKGKDSELVLVRDIINPVGGIVPNDVQRDTKNITEINTINSLVSTYLDIKLELEVGTKAYDSIKEYEAEQKTTTERKAELIEKLISSDPSGVGVGK